MNKILTDSVEIKSNASSIAEIEKAADVFFQQASLSQEMYGKVYLALIEASENAIRHGNKQDPNKKVKVSFEKNERQIILKIKDSGEGFDFSLVPDPTLPENIDKPNGRGLFIISNLSDELEFNDLGNEIIITFNID